MSRFFALPSAASVAAAQAARERVSSARHRLEMSKRIVKSSCDKLGAGKVAGFLRVRAKRFVGEHRALAPAGPYDSWDIPTIECVDRLRGLDKAETDLTMTLMAESEARDAERTLETEVMVKTTLANAASVEAIRALFVANGAGGVFEDAVRPWTNRAIMAPPVPPVEEVFDSMPNCIECNNSFLVLPCTDCGAVVCHGCSVLHHVCPARITTLQSIKDALNATPVVLSAKANATLAACLALAERDPSVLEQ